MPLDTRLLATAAPGYVPPLDPTQVVGRGLGLAQAYRQSQVEQLQLAEAQRQEQERGTLAQAFRGALVTDPATGQTRVDMPRAFSEAYRTTSDPLTVFKAQQSYEKSQAASAKDVLEARKTQLETLEKQTGYVSQLANGVLAVEAQGGDVEAAYQQALQQAAQVLGPQQMRGLPPTYDRGVVTQFAAQGQTHNERIKNELEVTNQRLREAELGETQKRTQIEQRRAELEERRVGVQEEEVDVRRGETEEKRQERLQTREGQQQQRLGERENQLRDEFNTLTKDYRTVSDAYGRMRSAQETGPGDISLIFSYMRLLDPGSTVREGEFATAQNAGGVPERVIAQYNRLVSGGRLAPETRRQFLDQAEDLYNRSTRDFERTKKNYEEMTRRYGADPANVTQDFGSTAGPREPKKPAGRAGGATSPHGHIALDKMTPQQLQDEIAWWEAQEKQQQKKP